MFGRLRAGAKLAKLLIPADGGHGVLVIVQSDLPVTDAYV